MYKIHGKGNKEIDGKGVDKIIEILLHFPFLHKTGMILTMWNNWEFLHRDILEWPLYWEVWGPLFQTWSTPWFSFLPG